MVDQNGRPERPQSGRKLSLEQFLDAGTSAEPPISCNRTNPTLFRLGRKTTRRQ